MSDLIEHGLRFKQGLTSVFFQETEVTVLLSRSDWMHLKSIIQPIDILTADLMGHGPEVNGLLYGGVRYRLKAS